MKILNRENILNRLYLLIQKININPSVYIYDSPGIVEPTFDEIEIGFKLACLSNYNNEFLLFFQIKCETNISIKFDFRLLKKSSGECGHSGRLFII
jgi:hypothetical protein